MTTLPAMSADEGTKRDSISAGKVTTIASEQNTAFFVLGTLTFKNASEYFEEVTDDNRDCFMFFLYS